MIQEWVDRYREWRLRRDQAAGEKLKQAAKEKMDRRDWWRRSIGEPWQDAVCWTCMVALGLVMLVALLVLAVRR